MLATYTKRKGSFELVKTRDIFMQPLTSSSESESDEVPSSSGKTECLGKHQKDTKKSTKSTDSEPNLDDFDIIEPSAVLDVPKETASQEVSSKPPVNTSKKEQTEEDYDAEESGNDDDEESEDEKDTEQTGWLGFSTMRAALNRVKSYLFPSDE